jgi:hypothetical protein
MIRFLRNNQAGSGRFPFNVRRFKQLVGASAQVDFAPQQRHTIVSVLGVGNKLLQCLQKFIFETRAHFVKFTSTPISKVNKRCRISYDVHLSFGLSLLKNEIQLKKKNENSTSDKAEASNTAHCPRVLFSIQIKTKFQSRSCFSLNSLNAWK